MTSFLSIDPALILLLVSLCALGISQGFVNELLTFALHLFEAVLALAIEQKLLVEPRLVFELYLA